MPPKSTTKAPKPPKPWRREEGVYRSADDRFTIEGGGAGRWFLTDAEALDELGLARTLGPYDTLDEAKGAADDQRAHAAQASPLAERLAAAKARPSATRGARSPRAGSKDAASTREADDADAQGPTRRETAATRAARKPPPRTWIEELADEDPDAADRARGAVAALERLGIDDADGVVRRDVLGRQPAVAARLLGRSIAEGLRSRLEPGSLHTEATSAIPGPMKALRDADDAALGAYAAFVAARVVDTVLAIVTATDRAEDAGRDLPGWRLIERPAARDGSDALPRRLILTRDDVTQR
jgi:hypothetical protein